MLINDTLARYGDAPFLKNHERFIKDLYGIRVRPPVIKKIVLEQVSVACEVEVTRACGHTDYHRAIEYIPVSQDEAQKMPVFVCDKCDAWSDDAEAWNE